MIVSSSSTRKVVLQPVPWSHGPQIQNMFVEELSILISSLLSTRPMTQPGSLLVRLANGWVLSGCPAIEVCRIIVTLNCQIDPVGEVKARVVRAAY